MHPAWVYWAMFVGQVIIGCLHLFSAIASFSELRRYPFRDGTDIAHTKQALAGSAMIAAVAGASGFIMWQLAFLGDAH